ncbi:hypothetical protein F5X99DRAFT_432584 [Biscogniauxia marginata]|nr:hypothetical protein F5X99DRAFT_432584 [Biscogniauxia marginata]
MAEIYRLDALLFGDPEGIEEADTDNPQNNKSVLRRRPLEKREELAKKDYDIAVVDLTEDILFSFVDEADTTGWARGMLGVTQPVIDPDDNTPVLIRLNISSLRALCSGDLTAAETCLAQFQLAKTHAIWYQRKIYLPIPEDEESSDGISGSYALSLDGGLYVNEPFFEDEFIAELGFSFENAVFGGKMMHQPEDFKPGLYAGIYFQLSIRPWPNSFDAMRVDYEMVLNYDQNVPDCMKGRWFHVPIFWVSALQNEDFWNSVVLKYGSRMFNPPRLFEATISAKYNLRRTHGLRPIPSTGNIVEFQPDLDRLSTKWKTKRRTWRSLRPWAQREYKRWVASPWSWPQARQAIKDFRDAFFKKQINIAMKSAQILLDFVDLSRNCLTSSSSSGFDPNSLLFHGLGCLMMASLPYKSPDNQVGAESSTIYQRSEIAAKDNPDLPIQVEAFNTNNFSDIIDTVSYRDTLRNFKEDNDIGDPCKYLDYFRKLFERYEQELVLPRAWVVPCMQLYHKLRSERIPGLASFSWASSFEFDVPSYDNAWVKMKSDATFDAVVADKYEDVSEPTFVKSLYITPPLTPPSPGIGPPSDIYSSAKMAITKGPDMLRYPKHYTIGEVANHRSLQDVWVLETDSNGGFDVYDITNILSDLKFTEVQYKQIITKDSNGLHLRHNNQAHLVREYMISSPGTLKGKLLQWRHLEEIRECTGENGSPFWVIHGSVVYDITNFHISSDEEMAQLKSNPGGPIELSGLPERDEEILERLNEYRCALVLPQPGNPQEILGLYTLSQLRRHDNPENGVYVAIDGFVYNMNGYLDFHPGGWRILQQWAGRDATEEFYKYHRHGLLMEEDYISLKIGKIVPEMTIAELQSNHITLKPWVFDISGLEEEKPWCYHAIKHLGGTDASDRLSIQPPLPETRELISVQMDDERVVGTVKEPHELPEISVSEFRKRNGCNSVSKQAWTAVDGIIYEVTDLVRLPGWWYPYHLQTEWAGKTLDDHELATWLVNKHSHRQIARLVYHHVPGGPWDGVPKEQRPPVYASQRDAYRARMSMDLKDKQRLEKQIFARRKSRKRNTRLRDEFISKRYGIQKA